MEFLTETYSSDLYRYVERQNCDLRMQATVSFHCLKWASVKPEFKQREQGSNIDVNFEAPLLAD